jgi:putative heme iron utilization protein
VDLGVVPAMSGHDVPGAADRAAEPAEAPARPPAPEPSHAERVRTLLAGAGRGSLSTIALDPAGYPFGSVVSFGLDAAGRPSFFVSTLAEHTRNLQADPRASLLVTEDVPPGSDPLAAGRVTLIGDVAEITDAEERAAAREAYLAANPGAFYVDYGDFRCLRLEVRAVRYVGGFGRMSWVAHGDYAAARPDPLLADAVGIIGHMNADHADALVELTRHQGGRTDATAAVMTAVDRYGFDVVAEVAGEDRRAAVRIGFRSPQDDADHVRRELVAMLHEARRRSRQETGAG